MKVSLFQLNNNFHVPITVAKTFPYEYSFKGEKCMTYRSINGHCGKFPSEGMNELVFLNIN